MAASVKMECEEILEPETQGPSFKRPGPSRELASASGLIISEGGKGISIGDSESTKYGEHESDMTKAVQPATQTAATVKMECMEILEPETQDIGDDPSTHQGGNDVSMLSSNDNSYIHKGTDNDPSFKRPGPSRELASASGLIISEGGKGISIGDSESTKYGEHESDMTKAVQPATQTAATVKMECKEILEPETQGPSFKRPGPSRELASASGLIISEGGKGISTGDSESTKYGEHESDLTKAVQPATQTAATVKMECKEILEPETQGPSFKRPGPSRELASASGLIISEGGKGISTGDSESTKYGEHESDLTKAVQPATQTAATVKMECKEILEPETQGPSFKRPGPSRELASASGLIISEGGKGISTGDSESTKYGEHESDLTKAVQPATQTAPTVKMECEEILEPETQDIGDDPSTHQGGNDVSMLSSNDNSYIHKGTDNGPSFKRPGPSRELASASGLLISEGGKGISIGDSESTKYGEHEGDMTKAVQPAIQTAPTVKMECKEIFEPETQAVQPATQTAATVKMECKEILEPETQDIGDDPSTHQGGNDVSMLSSNDNSYIHKGTDNGMSNISGSRLNFSDNGKCFVCSICNKAFNRKSNLRVHLKIHTGENQTKSFVCSICNKAFGTKSNLSCHLRIHTGERPFKCSHCDKAFTVSSSLHAHVRIHTGERPYVCTVCDKGFTESSQLQKHMRNHTGERPYKCTYCEGAFTQKSSLDSHMKMHTGDKPYQCSICHKVCRTSSEVQVHMRVHTGERPYKCSLCDMSFSRPDSVEKHMRTHTGEKPYSCCICQKSFSVSSALHRHFKTHTGEKPYRCEICGKSFTESGNLNKHMRNIHNSGGKCDEASTYIDIAQSQSKQ